MPAVTYEITAKVRGDLCESYEKYMTERHIPDLLATRTFASATFSRSAPGRYRIRYEAFSRETLTEYFKSHAPHLRAEMNKNFPVGVELAREEWDIIQAFGDRS